jgi:hypothetical protein
MMLESNPYQSPATLKEPTVESERTIRQNFALIAVAGFCGICIGAYGMLGSILNGLDLLRTLSAADAIKEAWLACVMATGFLICMLVYRLKTNRATANVSLCCFGIVAVSAVIAYLEFG